MSNFEAPMISDFYSCSVCSLLLAWNNQSKTADVLSKFLDLETDSTEPNLKSTCSICLGILEKTYSRRIIDEAVEKFQSVDYDVDTFNLALTLPPACLVRERVARLWKESKSGDQRIGDDDRPIFTFGLKDACRLCYHGGIERKLSAGKIINFDAQSDFTIAFTFDNPKADECCRNLQRCFPGHFSAKNGKKKRRWNDTGASKDGNNSEWSRTAIMDILPSLTTKMVEEFDLMAPLRDHADECSVSTNLSRTPLFIGGRYCKYSRHLTQTPWIIDGIRRGDSSVQELICNQLIKSVGAEDVKFTSSGREDTDVRMLGDGRPFALQFINARRKRTLNQSEIDNFQSQINQSTKDVQVVQLRVVTAQEFAALKVGEEHKKKTYVALVWSPESFLENDVKDRIRNLTALGPIELDQKTPIRVLHRRPLAIRKRTVENFGATIVGEHYFQLRMTTQAGTYVKEFVHGDFGRTKPSLGDLLGGIPVDILELDVERIDLSWP